MLKRGGACGLLPEEGSTSRICEAFNHGARAREPDDERRHAEDDGVHCGAAGEFASDIQLLREAQDQFHLDLVESQAKSQFRIDRLNALIDIVERHISEGGREAH